MMLQDEAAWILRIESSLAKTLDLPGLRSGPHIIRNHRGWRQNEKEIDYTWIVNISRSFIDFGGVFTVKFNKHEFRDISNPEEIIRGVFTYNANGEFTNWYFEKDQTDFADSIKEFSQWNPFEANRGITLDGIYYQLLIRARNIDTVIAMNNPNSSSWRSWEQSLFELGKRLAEKSKSTELIQLFK
jgi:hypothetical protein